MEEYGDSENFIVHTQILDCYAEQRWINTVSDKCFLLFRHIYQLGVFNKNNVQTYRGGDTRNELFKGSQLGALCP